MLLERDGGQQIAVEFHRQLVAESGKPVRHRSRGQRVVGHEPLGQVSPEQRAALEEAGVEVVIAPAAGERAGAAGGSSTEASSSR
ncbi:MAG TPA: hypothetical protein VN133_05610 [Humibacter sp.]|nr:hypothetical protein [Humibacter sp.]